MVLEDTQRDKIAVCDQISVIASFSRTGRVKPLYAQLAGQEAAKIVEILYYKKESYFGSDTFFYRCTCLSGKDLYQHICLRYFIKEHAWQFARMDMVE